MLIEVRTELAMKPLRLALEVHVFLRFAGRMVAAGKNDLWLNNDPVHHDLSRWIFFEVSLGMVSIVLNQQFIQ